MNHFSLLVAVVMVIGQLVGFPPPAQAESTFQESMPEVVGKQCLGCHQVTKQRVGPAFLAIAKRYQEADNASEYLVTMIRAGSRGQWGAIPMPAQTHVSEAEARQVADWLLSIDLDAVR